MGVEKQVYARGETAESVLCSEKGRKIVKIVQKSEGNIGMAVSCFLEKGMVR